MTTLAERANIAEDPAFIRRVRQAAVNAAIDVAAELPVDPVRRQLAARIVANPDGWAAVIAVGIAQNPNAGTGISDPVTDDGALQYVANQLFDAYTDPVPVEAPAAARMTDPDLKLEQATQEMKR